MGLRVRLKANVDISRLPYQARIVAVALKRYGMMLADNGSAWYVSGAPDRHWNNDALHLLDQLTGRDFEVGQHQLAPASGTLSRGVNFGRPALFKAWSRDRRQTSPHRPRPGAARLRLRAPGRHR